MDLCPSWSVPHSLDFDLHFDLLQIQCLHDCGGPFQGARAPSSLPMPGLGTYQEGAPGAKEWEAGTGRLALLWGHRVGRGAFPSLPSGPCPLQGRGPVGGPGRLTGTGREGLAQTLVAPPRGPRSVPHSHRSRAAPRCATRLGEDLPGLQNAGGAAVGMDPCSEGTGPESEPPPLGLGTRLSCISHLSAQAAQGRGAPTTTPLPPVGPAPCQAPSTQKLSPVRPRRQHFTPCVAEGTGSEGRCRRGLE